MDGGSDDDGFLSDDSWADDRSGRYVYAARPQPQWAFLTKWFKRVASRCSISDAERANSHPVRIGREMDDLWIDVLVEDGSTMGYVGLGRTKPVDPAWRAAELRGAREGLLLLAALAQVDYKSWIGGMVRKAYFPVPDFLELQHCPEIAREFCFFLNSYLEPLYYQWDVLQHLMGDEDFSDEFTQDLTKITDAATATGCEIDVFPEIPIKLALEPEGTDGEDLERELEILRGVTQSVRELLLINERNRRAAGSARARPWFRFDSIDLDLNAFSVHPEVFNGIRELLETGIQVKTLKLPRRTSQEDVGQKTLARAWIELIVTSLGHRVFELGHVVQLDRLEVPNHYMTEQFMVPLCSALRETKVLTQLSLDFNGFHELESASQRRLWKWIDFALFSPTPLNSVDTLELGFIKPLATACSRLVSGEESPDPVGDLWKAETGASDGLDLDASDRSIVEIAIGTTLLGLQDQEIETMFCYEGILIRDQATKPTVDVLVPGLGFCQVPREQITRGGDRVLKSEHVASPKQIKTLDLHLSHDARTDGESDEHAAAMRAFTERLLQFVGPSLTALALECNLLDGTDIQMTARLCPHLHSLRLHGVTVESMDVLLSLYEAPIKCQITSLDLSHLHIPIEAFENFLAVLTPKIGLHPIQQTLQRICIGGGYSGTFRQVTRRAITSILRSNVKLSHFLLDERRRHGGHHHGGFVRDTDDDENSDDDEEDEEEEDDWNLANYFNGELLCDYSLSVDRIRAFLSVVRQLSSQSHAARELSSDLLQLVFSFAADRVWRRAYSLRDVYSDFIHFMPGRVPTL